MKAETDSKYAEIKLFEVPNAIYGNEPKIGTKTQNNNKNSNASELPSRFEVLWVRSFKIEPTVRTIILKMKKINEDLWSERNNIKNEVKPNNAAKIIKVFPSQYIIRVIAISIY